MSTYDAIVVGLGALGSAALYQLSRRGLRVLGIDRFAPPHALGSSHGELRITREAIGEGAEYVPLARRSHVLWREIEREAGETLFVAAGVLILGRRGGAARHHGMGDFVGNTIDCAERFGIAHEILGAGEVARRFPQFAVAPDELGYFEPGARFLRPERCVAAQLALARRGGAELRTGERVLSFEENASGNAVEVRTDAGSYAGRHLVVAAGPWIIDLLAPQLRSSFNVYRQVQYWFAPEDAGAFTADRLPVFIWMYGRDAGDHFYGFPLDEATGSVKVATEAYDATTHPDAVDREVGAVESGAMYARHIAGRLRGIRPGAVRSSVCLYTSTPDGRFVIDAHPSMPRVLLVSACSGHGFKHSPAIAEAIAERITAGASCLDLVAFSMARLARGSLQT